MSSPRTVRRSRSHGRNLSLRAGAAVKGSVSWRSMLPLSGRSVAFLMMLMLMLKISAVEFVLGQTPSPHWVQTTYVKASNTESGDRFGIATSLSGNRLVVGATEEDSCAGGDQQNNGCTGAGAVFIYERDVVAGTWNFSAFIKASNAEAGDHFGSGVSLDGDRLAVGATGEDSCAVGVNGVETDNSCVGSGAVYVFDLVGGMWTQTAYMKASNTEAVDFFGQSLSLDRDFLAVGAPGQNGFSAVDRGAVYVFTFEGGSWTEKFFVTASNPGAADAFGTSISLDGDRLVVGAPLEDSCFATDQTNEGCSAAGAVYIFHNLTGPTLLGPVYVKPTVVGAADRFGWRVSLDGDRLAVSAYFEDSCLASDANNNGCSNSGAVYVFEFDPNSGAWSQRAYLKASNPGAADRFGQGLSLDGDLLAVGSDLEDSCGQGVGATQGEGCSNSGAAYLFAFSPGTFSWSQVAYIKANNSGEYDESGFVVSLDGAQLAVGASREDSCAIGASNEVPVDDSCFGSGAVHIFADLTMLVPATTGTTATTGSFMTMTSGSTPPPSPPPPSQMMTTATGTTPPSTTAQGVGVVDGDGESSGGGGDLPSWLIPVVAAGGAVLCLALLACVFLFIRRNNRSGAETEDLPSPGEHTPDAAPVYASTAHVSVRSGEPESPPIYNAIGTAVATPTDGPIYNSVAGIADSVDDGHGSIYNTTEGIRQDDANGDSSDSGDHYHAI